MLFYERIPEDSVSMEDPMTSLVADEIVDMAESHKFKVELSKELKDWIWQDNMQFLQVRKGGVWFTGGSMSLGLLVWI